MDNILRRLYKEYGSYSNWRAFPLSIDGLKPVERRVLLSAYKIARDRMTKSRTLSAYTIGHFHPHGDVYGTIVQLVRQGFLTGQGNFGTNIGVEPVGPAADRYTECKLSKKSIELAFNYINHVPWIDTELNDKEPAYLPSMYPLCLLGTEYTVGIGFGFKTTIPCYTVEDLKRRLMWLIGVKKTKPTITPITDCIILSPPADLEELLTVGKAKIAVQGIIQPIPRNSKVILKSWPPGKRFESLLGKFDKELESGLIGFTDASSTSTEIVFEVLRERNVEKIYKDFVHKLQEVVKGDISFDTRVVDKDHKVILSPIDKLLLDAFDSFRTVNRDMITHEIEKITESITEYNLLKIIRPLLSDCFKRGLNLEDSVNSIVNAIKVSRDSVENLIEKYRIKKLLTLNIDIEELKNKKQELTNNLNNLQEFVIGQY
jgi:DNA gyrase/topoisomerase IV subunit A